MQQPVLLHVNLQVTSLHGHRPSLAINSVPRMATLAAIRAYARAVRPL